jgi:hypothetical protein
MSEQQQQQQQQPPPSEIENEPETETKVELTAEGCYVALTHDPLDVKAIMDRVRSPEAGAIVLFAGE